MDGSRSIYQDGWKAELPYPNSFISGNAWSNSTFDGNARELYNLREDPTERIDLAKKYPEKLAALKILFDFLPYFKSQAVPPVVKKINRCLITHK